MAKLEQTMTVSTVQELRPELRQRVIAQLDTYQEQNLEYKLLKEARDATVDAIYSMLKAEGINAAEIPELAKLTEVGGFSSKFDKQKFVALGGDLAIYDAAVKKTPKKKYLKITLAGEKDESHGDE